MEKLPIVECQWCGTEWTIVSGDQGMDRDYEVRDNRCKFCDVPLSGGPATRAPAEGGATKALAKALTFVKKPWETKGETKEETPEAAKETKGETKEETKGETKVKKPLETKEETKDVKTRRDSATQCDGKECPPQ